MIRLEQRPPAPDTLKSRRVARKKAVIAAKVRSKRKLKSKDFAPYWQESDVRKTLWESQHHKCCYCERRRELMRESDVEHYRPKAGVAEEPGHRGYWWLAYEWSNYLYACKPCNQGHKKNHFPLLRNGRRARRESDNLLHEHPVLINPFDEDPEQYIAFDWQQSYGHLVKAVALDDTGRGEGTIRLMQLNSDELMEERARLILGLDALALTMKVADFLGNQADINRKAEKIRGETSPNNAFAGLRRAFFRAHGLSQHIAAQ